MKDIQEVIEPLDDVRSIIQPKNGYRFGSDAVALARFACGGIKRGARVLDLCSGCGIVGILINAELGASIVGVELDPVLCDMSVRSAAMNGMTDVTFINADVREIAQGRTDYGRFDAVVCNPPFYKADSKPASVAPGANSELTVTFCDVAAAARRALVPGGELYIVHTASRLDEALCTCRDNKLMPKSLTVNTNGKTFLLRCVLGGRPGLTVRTGRF